MATDDEAAEYPPGEDMLPDEREVILERVDDLDDPDAHLTVEEVADELGIELD